MKDTTAVKNLKKWKTVVNALKEWWKKIHKGQGKSAAPAKGRDTENGEDDTKETVKGFPKDSYCFVMYSNFNEIEGVRKLYNEQIDECIERKDRTGGKALLKSIQKNNEDNPKEFDEEEDKLKAFLKLKKSETSGRKKEYLFYKGGNPYSKDEDKTSEAKAQFLGYLSQHGLMPEGKAPELVTGGLKGQNKDDIIPLNKMIIAFLTIWGDSKEVPSNGAIFRFFHEDCGMPYKGERESKWTDETINKRGSKWADEIIKKLWDSKGYLQTTLEGVKNYCEENPLPTNHTDRQ